ncbi:MAG: GAF domain-containing protein [Bacteroidia bacterium]|nr:GAF domain-containing protein [Bacteroidia bacterium]MDW8333776.1 GAF domain-containing protein [Bacteroidia bacterium]
MKKDKEDYERWQSAGEREIEAGESLFDAAERLCRFLHQNLKHFSWVGVYWVESFAMSGGSEEALVLGPYCGSPTEHKCIAFGAGVCGTAARLRLPIVVPDVGRVENYLCCDLSVRSEMVVPIFAPEFVGLLDVDSPVEDAFCAYDIRLLTNLCRRLGEKAQS